jgi:flagellar hook-length control protein FliK
MTQNGAAANSTGGGVNTIDRARFVQRVASAFQVAGDQGGEIRLRLSPPELGSLQMQISVKQGVLSATIQADNTTAQQVLLDSLPDLRDRLAQQDIRIDRFDVGLMGQGSGGMPQPQDNRDFNQQSRRPAAASTNTTSSTTSTETNRSPASTAIAASGALNIVV